MTGCMTQAGAAGMRPDGGPRAREGAADAEGSAKCTADCPPDCTGAIVACIPALRVFARSLCRDVVEADDLVQETLVRAIEKLHLFEPGTNLRAWLFTIMRNRFYSNWTRRARERPGEKDCASTVPVAPPDSQIWHIRGRELERALLQLPVHYRETIMLVTVLGESYRQAAEVLGCDIGTIKSRVNRARAALREALGDAGGT